MRVTGNTFLGYTLLWIILLISTHITPLSGQECNVSGYVTDSATGERIINASVYCKDNTVGTITNQEGYYNLEFEEGKQIVLIVSHVGYTPEILHLHLDSSLEKNISLTPASYAMDEVRVTHSVQPPDKDLYEMSTLDVPVQSISYLPALGGEKNLMKVAQLMPGINFGREGTNSLYVRGGNASQNLILLDGMPLYYLNHMGGFVSIFDDDAINSARLYKGAFPASYGGRVSSVFDIRMNDGNSNHLAASLKAGIVSSKFSIEGPVKDSNTTFFLSGRRLTMDLFMNAYYAIADNTGISGYTFWDTNAKITHKFNRSNRIALSFYAGDDHQYFKHKDGFDKSTTNYNKDNRWGNLLGAMHWYHTFSPGLAIKTSVGFTRYRYKKEDEFKEKDENSPERRYKSFFSGIVDYRGKSSLEYDVSNYYTIKGGISSFYRKFNPKEMVYKKQEDNTSVLDTSKGSSVLNSVESSLFLENRFALGDYFNFNLGFRTSAFFIKDHAFYSYEPRLLMTVRPADRWKIQCSLSKMQQNIHFISYMGLDQPVDLWLPVTKNAPPEESWQTELGITHDLFDDEYNLTLEGYYRKMNNLVEFKEQGSIYSFRDSWENKIYSGGKGESYGAEIMLRKKRGRLKGWLSYTLSWATRQFDEINDGKSYFFSYDRRHSISLVMTYRITDRLVVAGNWVYASGRPITMPSGNISTISNLSGNLLEEKQNNQLFYDGKNNIRAEDHHRFDISLSYTKEKKWGKGIWSFSLYNLYNRKNPYSYFFRLKADQSDNDNFPGTRRKLYKRTLFPLIPSLSYTWKF